LSKAELDSARIIGVESVSEPLPEERAKELREFLTSSFRIKQAAPSAKNDEGAGTLPDEADERGAAFVVQETLPEAELPKKEPPRRMRVGIFPPPPDIFGPPAGDDEGEDSRDLAQEQANVIVTTLQNFGVKATVAHIVVGPSVIQFQLELAPGIKVSKVAGLASDLTMALAVVSVRVEAPILGQRYVGIEIPNPGRRVIPLRSVVESEEFRKSDARLLLPMGVRVDSKHLVCGLEDMPHLLVAGTTGSGKSVFTNTCILGMCSQRSPEELKLILVDPKYVEFAIYDGLPHLLARPVSDPKKAIAALSWAVQEMENRSECFARAKVRNLASYNEKVLPKSRFPHIVVVVDELADLMYTSGREVEGLIARLAQKARAAGIHLILATQRPSVDVITGLIKANVPARVAFAVPSQTDSRTIIDTGGAEKLLGRGDMLFYSTRYPRPLRLQAAFITEERTLAFVDYMKNIFGEPEYIDFEDCVSGRNGGGENGARSGSAVIDDPRIEEAIRVVMDTGIASASGLQRYLNVGHTRAGRLVTGLEQLGIVGPLSMNSSKPREILMDEESAYGALEKARNGGVFGG
jgi:S-DNA-T family DNA segregation ATPase FtsK/SpoIIIE